MSAILAVTLGNSTAALAVASDGQVGEVLRVPVQEIERLRQRLDQAHRDRLQVALVASSVNPAALECLQNLASEVTQAVPDVAGVDFPIPIATDVEEPERVGADRLLGALAAYRRVRGACIIVDFGTAITVNAVQGDGTFVGGAIFPGLTMMARSLAAGTALLPSIVLSDGGPAIGRNTQKAMGAGIFHGAAGAVTRLVSGAREVVGSTARVIVTGGDSRVAELLPPDCRTIVPDLVMEGLIAAYREYAKR